MEKMIRVLIGLAVAGGAIWYSFQPREPSKFSPKVVGGYEVSEQTTNDPLAIPLPQITQNPPKQLPTEVQKTIQDCLAQSKVPFDSQAIFAVKSLETLRGLLTTKQAPKSRTRTREAITFQTGDQMRDGLKSRALYAPLDVGNGKYGWKLFTVPVDGLPDPVTLPPDQVEAKKQIADMLRKSTVLEHDRDEVFTWANGSTADVKLQDQRIVELAFKFDGKLLGCASDSGAIACKCL